ncbi:uncharacterized protein DDB_G0284459 [Drosophila eugracilis]|uniref:uncharacterized protein DDB_G0284459 n=1 Tax=Drosophila eugracilis TaxID=29029 RepID=UPI0007E86CAC|nr:uncharacterized protein DDB_G0284459 [Drosophila eugracilis]
MSHGMSEFLGGVRRSPQERTRAIRARLGTGTGRSGGGAGSSPAHQRPPSGTNAAAVVAAGGIASSRTGNRVTPSAGLPKESGGSVPKRSTGGTATRVYNNTCTSTLRRGRHVHPPPLRIPEPRPIKEVKWIMKPSESFVPCSESSSEDNDPLQIKSFTEGDDDAGKSSSSGGLRKSQPAEPVAKNKVRSRTFCVPSQRIMHTDKLMEAQLLQMQLRKRWIHSHSPSRSRSPNWSARRSPGPLTSTKSPNRSSSSSSSQSVSQSSSRMPSSEKLKDVPLYDSKTLLPGINETTQPTPQFSGLISCCPSPNASPHPSQSRLQSPSISSICSSMDTTTKSHTSSSSPYSNTSSSNSSISTNGSGYRTLTSESTNLAIPETKDGVSGSKAIKLTSTVIEIIKPAMTTVVKKTSKIRSKKEHGKLALPLQTKIHSAFQQKRHDDSRRAMNAPMVQSISPSKFTPKVQVDNPISQSVNHVVNQLTAQLKEAAMMPKEQALKDKDVYKAWSSKAPSRKPSIYLLMNQPKGQSAASSNDPSKDSWVIQPMEQPNDTKPTQELFSKEPVNQKKDQSLKQQTTNPYLSESKDHPRHNFSPYVTPLRIAGGNQQINEPKNQAVHHPLKSHTIPPRNWNRNQSQNHSRSHSSRHTSRSSFMPKSTIASKTRISMNPYIYESKHLSKAPTKTQRRPTVSQPVSLNRTTGPSTSTGRSYVAPPPEPQQPEQPATSGKIVRKFQHKVPRTMEDGIDMSYQYFVSIPLKRGKKPQVVRYLYRPMVRQLNSPSPSRRSSRRAKTKAAADAEEQQPTTAEENGHKIDPELEALGGMPLPLEGLPNLTSPEGIVKSKIVLDPEDVLNAPYEVPPLKLEARYMPMMEELAQMPYPEDRPNRRRRFKRSIRAAGGADQVPSTDPHQRIGGGDAIKNEMRSMGRLSSIWTSGSPRLPRLLNYRPEAQSLRTGTGAPISYHTPVHIGQFTEADKVFSGQFVLPVEPMIHAVTYADVLEYEKKEQEQTDHPLEESKVVGATGKSVSFHPGDIVNEIATRSNSINTGSSSSRTKGRRASKKSKVKSKGKAKTRK